MPVFPFTPEQRALVSAAVTAAEDGTDGEIVTIVSQRSDNYRDTGLVWGVLAMLLVVALAAFFPRWFDEPIGLVTSGWGEAPSTAVRYLTLLVAELLVFALVFLLFRAPAIRVGLTLPGIKAYRVRHRAVQYFKVGAEARTAARVGVLLFLSLDEHRAEIVADEAIHAKVPHERWGEAMVALIDEVRAGRPAQGMAAAVAHIGAIIAEHFPKTDDDKNELPDRLIEL